MNAAWAVVLKGEDALSLAFLRCERDIEVHGDDGALWVRGGEASPELELALRKLPCVERYSITEDRQLVRRGALVPRGQLPEGEWIPIERYLRVASRASALAGETSRRVPLRLVRGTKELTPTVLITSFDAWLDYTTKAPECRLRPLAFAASATGRAFVRGAPLPPLPGTLCVDRGGIVVPAGYEWTPRVDAEIVRDLLDLAAGALALFGVDGAVDIISEESLVAASRCAVRRTAAALRETADE